MVKYKTVALGHLEGKPGQKADVVLNPVAKVIESETVGGWTFVNMYDMPIKVKPGCIAGLLGRQYDDDHFYMLVFKKED